MNATATDTLSPYGPPAPGIRLFGWSMLSLLAAFLINNILHVWGGVAPLAQPGQDRDQSAWIPLAVYALAMIAATAWVLRTGNISLRYDARRISDFNAFLIRACFFSVLFVGIADGIVSFMRVEGLLAVFFADETVLQMVRARYIATLVHLPLIILGFVVALFSRTPGFHWLALLIVLAELLIVFSRFVFSYEQALMGDLVRYWYAALFLFASAYTLLEEGHVRVDVFYAGFTRRGKGHLNSVGTVLLGFTTCWCIVIIGMGSAQSIINSPVRNFEVSQTGTSGAYTKYQMAAFLGIFAVTMLIQFVSYFFEAVADARGERGHRDHTPAAHQGRN